MCEKCLLDGGKAGGWRRRHRLGGRGNLGEGEREKEGTREAIAERGSLYTWGKRGIGIGRNMGG